MPVGLFSSGQQDEVERACANDAKPNEIARVQIETRPSLEDTLADVPPQHSLLNPPPWPTGPQLPASEIAEANHTGALVDSRRGVVPVQGSTTLSLRRRSLKPLLKNPKDHTPGVHLGPSGLLCNQRQLGVRKANVLALLLQKNPTR